jgi:hypothetical protein
MKPFAAVLCILLALALIVAAFGVSVGKVGDICLHDGLVQGHPDGEVAGELLEIKTVESADHLPIPPRCQTAFSTRCRLTCTMAIMTGCTCSISPVIPGTSA